MKDLTFIQDYIKITRDAAYKGWHERNGGNISYRLNAEDIAGVEPYIDTNTAWSQLEANVPGLANEVFIISGSGKFIRDICLNLEENCGLIEINAEGDAYRIIWGLHDAVPTSELPTHLLSHEIKKSQNPEFRVIMHSHTTNIIALTFILPLDGKVFTKELWEMATECPVVFPEGIGVVPWMVPGGKAIGNATMELMKKHNLVIWAHHGTFAAAETLNLAYGLMDTAEKAAEILVKVLAMGGKKQTITAENFTDLAQDFNVTLMDIK